MHRIIVLISGLLLLLLPLNGWSQLVPRPMVRLPLQLRESSGLAFDDQPRFWSHNDAGNSNQIFYLDTLGNVLRTITLQNVQNTDWEDLAADPQGNLYINDAGNNDNNRTNLAIHILSNPLLNPSNQQQAQSITFQFPDQTAFPPPGNNRNFDIEAIVWHSDSIFLFTKNRSSPTNGMCKMYALKASPGTQQAMLRDSVFTGFTQDDRVTAAAISPSGNTLILLTRKGLHIFDDYADTHFLRGRKTFLPFQPLPGQAEGIDFLDNHTLWMSEEGSSNHAGTLYEVRLPPTLHLNESGRHKPGCRIVNNRLTFGDNMPGNALVLIFDQTGRLCANTLATNLAEIPNLGSGIYNLMIINNNEHLSCRIMLPMKTSREK
ncbi:MAG: hypothetical protein IPM52_01080 [Bacteroidetes bacterium]|nr:hypothetical protein [Bacteroidota bacterium]